MTISDNLHYYSVYYLTIWICIICIIYFLLALSSVMPNGGSVIAVPVRVIGTVPQ
jgi:hypothetical protein